MDLEKVSILVVEDESIIALTIKEMLNQYGYSGIEVVGSGEKAIEAYREKEFGLVLMDIRLRGKLDGIETAQYLLSIREALVIFITAFSDKEALDRAKTVNPYGYLMKPFKGSDIHTCIQVALNRYQLERKIVENERWFSTTFNSISDAVISIDLVNRIRFINPAARHLIGLPEDEEPNGYLSSDIVLDCCDWSQPVSLLQLAVETRKGQTVLVPVSSLKRLNSDQTLAVNGELAPIVDDHKQILGTVIVLRDVSEKLRDEERLRVSYEQLRLTLKETVYSLIRTLEMRDPYTSGHQQRVAYLSEAVDRELSLSEQDIETICFAGLLHDIGKIYIPSDILSKPGRLRPAEMELIREHPDVGFEILRSIPFSGPVAELVRQHHERMNGSGYLRGLSGDSILLGARILAVADVMEAMSSHRPYRPALGLEHALEEIFNFRSTLYDPQVVDVCIFLFRNGRFSF